jgi:hypothetical protein
LLTLCAQSRPLVRHRNHPSSDRELRRGSERSQKTADRWQNDVVSPDEGQRRETFRDIFHRSLLSGAWLRLRLRFPWHLYLHPSVGKTSTTHDPGRTAERTPRPEEKRGENAAWRVRRRGGEAADQRRTHGAKKRGKQGKRLRRWRLATNDRAGKRGRPEGHVTPKDGEKTEKREFVVARAGATITTLADRPHERVLRAATKERSFFRATC